jgi:hypothetical protein
LGGGEKKRRGNGTGYSSFYCPKIYCPRRKMVFNQKGNTNTYVRGKIKYMWEYVHENVNLHG